MIGRTKAADNFGDAPPIIKKLDIKSLQASHAGTPSKSSPHFTGVPDPRVHKKEDHEKPAKNPKRLNKAKTSRAMDKEKAPFQEKKRKGLELLLSRSDKHKSFAPEIKHEKKKLHLRTKSSTEFVNTKDNSAKRGTDPFQHIIDSKRDRKDNSTKRDAKEAVSKENGTKRDTTLQLKDGNTTKRDTKEHTPRGDGAKESTPKRDTKDHLTRRDTKEHGIKRDAKQLSPRGDPAKRETKQPSPRGDGTKRETKQPSPRGDGAKRETKQPSPRGDASKRDSKETNPSIPEEGELPSDIHVSQSQIIAAFEKTYLNSADDKMSEEDYKKLFSKNTWKRKKERKKIALADIFHKDGKKQEGSEQEEESASVENWEELDIAKKNRRIKSFMDRRGSVRQNIQQAVLSTIPEPKHISDYVIDPNNMPLICPKDEAMLIELGDETTTFVAQLENLNTEDQEKDLLYYKDYFYQKEHINLLGKDPVIGPIIVSIEKEKKKRKGQPKG